jgi:hypothetical protein
MNERGGIPLALIIGIGIVIVLIGGFAFCTDALFEDEDERNDVGLPALVLTGFSGVRILGLVV